MACIKEMEKAFKVLGFDKLKSSEDVYHYRKDNVSIDYAEDFLQITVKIDREVHQPLHLYMQYEMKDLKVEIFEHNTGEARITDIRSDSVIME